MKEEKIVVSHIEDQTWNQNKNKGKFRWKYMVDSTEVKSHGISCGVLVLPPGEELPLHFHSPQEIYIIRQGEGLLLSSHNNKKVSEDSFVYIPKSFEDGLKKPVLGIKKYYGSNPSPVRQKYHFIDAIFFTLLFSS